MKRIYLVVIAVTALMFNTNAQERWYTKEAKVNFYCDGSAEKIEAFTNKGVLVIDAATGQLEVSVLMKAFTFEKALMQEHFNENYVESDKFPKAVFKGTIVDVASVKWTVDGTYPVKLKGQMTMHGVTNEMTASATITVKGGKPAGTSTFIITLADYKIEIPKLVADKVTEKVRIVVDAPLIPYVKQ
jgi:polyisoprenoid-binding protein YceI